MNKEVKELIEEIKVFNIEHSHHPYYLYTLDKKDVELLLDYINQLETNRDEAIEFIKKTQFDCGDFNCCGFGIWKDGRNELLEILERGKEDV